MGTRRFHSMAKNENSLHVNGFPECKTVFLYHRCIFSQVLEPCSYCNDRLLCLTRCPHRNAHQVLPNRTHPTMMMDAAAGYVLSGITVAKQEHMQRVTDNTPVVVADGQDPAAVYSGRASDLPVSRAAHA